MDSIKYSCDYLTKRTYNAHRIKDSSIVSSVKSLIKKSRRERVENRRLELDEENEDDEIEKNRTNDKINSKVNDEKQTNSLREDDNLFETSINWKDRNQKLCSCDRKRTKQDLSNHKQFEIGWEGPAILNHGSLIVFGCLEFTFSITDFGIVYSDQLD